VEGRLRHPPGSSAAAHTSNSPTVQPPKDSPSYLLGPTIRCGLSLNEVLVGRALDVQGKIPVEFLRSTTGANSPTRREQKSSVWNKILRLNDDTHPFGDYTHVCVLDMPPLSDPEMPALEVPAAVLDMPVLEVPASVLDFRSAMRMHDGDKIPRGLFRAFEGPRMAAFAMGNQPRLGANSMVLPLDEGVVRMILEKVH